MLAAREWIPRLAPALITLALALVLGRVWCGWICPLGTLLGWIRLRGSRRPERRVRPWLPAVKYVLLGVIAVMAAFGSLTLLVLDPIALLTRAATTSLLPGLDTTVTALETAALDSESGSGLVTWIETNLRGVVLPASQPQFEQALAPFLLLLAVVLLNLLADRFWCRYLCPLGALLGLAARFQVLRPLVGEGCTTCGACVRSCRMGAIERAAKPGAAASGRATPPARVVTTECTMCLDCLVACPEHGAMSVGSALRSEPWTGFDPGRRRFVTAAALGVGAALGSGALLLLGSSVAAGATKPRLIRPPGAHDEDAFLSRCLRCSECLLVCPTSGLQPALGQGGLEAIWTPVLTPRIGYCDYACTACGQVCPSGAIPEIALAAKRTQVLGRAAIDRARCLPWATDTPCVVCEEVCPVPHKAIVLGGQRLVTRADGTQDYLARPAVIPRRCIGCGICENKCPVEGTAAIVVQRHESEGNQRRRRRS